MEPTEADSEIEKEHLLNFVVNSLDEGLAIDLGEDVEVTTETLYEVLADASAGEYRCRHGVNSDSSNESNRPMRQMAAPTASRRCTGIRTAIQGVFSGISYS